MKAEISSTGQLKVSAETEIESFALKEWFKEYTRGLPGEDRSVTIKIETLEIKP